MSREDSASLQRFEQLIPAARSGCGTSLDELFELSSQWMLADLLEHHDSAASGDSPQLDSMRQTVAVAKRQFDDFDGETADEFVEWLGLIHRRVAQAALPSGQAIEFGRPSIGPSNDSQAASDSFFRQARDVPLSQEPTAVFDPTLVDSDVGPAFAGDDRFTVIRCIGSGGMGAVYEAFDRQRNQRVALKTMNRISANGLLRFKHEFRALENVTHPNLVALGNLFSFDDGKRLFYTMELVHGTDFGAYLRPDDDSSPVDFDRVRGLLRQLAAGLNALHDANVLHRDIKPSNVLVTAGGRVVLLDFGLAREFEHGRQHDTSSQRVVGTLSYMSPEQAACMKLTPASDWFSVGVMLYEVLTGRLPYPGGMLRAIIDEQTMKSPSPGEINPDVPGDLDALCVELMELKADRRPSGAEILRRMGEAPDEMPNPLRTPSTADRPLFIGRAAVLQSLDEALLEVGAGKTVCAFLHGQSGMGKSSLAARFLDSKRLDPNTVILEGRCHERETVPYKALDTLVDALSGYLSRLMPHDVDALMPRDVAALTRVFPIFARVEHVARLIRQVQELPDRMELRRRAFAALRELLGRLGDRKTLILFIDDLQWGDVDSATLLLDLFRPPDAPALLFLGCYRTEDINESPCLRTLLKSVQHGEQATDWRTWEVGLMSQEEAADFALAALGDDPEDRSRAARIAAESGGNPYFVQELVYHAELHDAGGDEDERADATTGPSLNAAIESRIDRLPASTRRLLEVVSVAGRPISRQVAAHVAAVGGEEMVAVSALRTARLIRLASASRGEAIETYHERIREATVANLSPRVLKDYHQRLARQLEAIDDALPEVIAMHFEEAGLYEDARDYAIKAARRAAEALAFERAVGWFRRALKYHDADSPEAHQMQIELADALAATGRSVEAADQYIAAAIHGDAAHVLEMRRRAAMQLLISGQVEIGREMADQVLAEVGVRMPRTRLGATCGLFIRRAQIGLRGLQFQRRDASEISQVELARLDSCWSVAAGSSGLDTIRGSYFQSRFLLMALRSGEPKRIARALAAEAAHRAYTGRPRDLQQ